MSESAETVERIGAKTKARIDELERVMKEILKAIEVIESEIGEPVMKVGNYYGIKFED